MLIIDIIKCIIEHLEKFIDFITYSCKFLWRF